MARRCFGPRFLLLVAILAIGGGARLASAAPQEGTVPSTWPSRWEQAQGVLSRRVADLTAPFKALYDKLAYVGGKVVSASPSCGYTPT
jgi:hypothetical protein